MPDGFSECHGHLAAEIEDGKRPANEENAGKACCKEGSKNDDGRPACLKQRTCHPVRQRKRGLGWRIEQKHR